MSAFACPECGSMQRGGAPGSVLACRACGNPLVVPEPEPPRPPVVSAPAAPARRVSPWGTAALVLLIVAVGHVGLYLLLTADARSAVRRLEGRHGAAALDAVRKPDEAPAPGSEAYTAWRAGVERYDDARAWRSHRRHVDLLRTGFAASFLVQVGITGWILLRLLGRRRRASPAPSQEAAPGGGRA